MSLNRSERKRISAGIRVSQARTRDRANAQLEQHARRLDKSQAPEVIKRFNRKFGKRAIASANRHQRGCNSLA